jgi:SAM-dependent methyltransferase
MSVDKNASVRAITRFARIEEALSEEYMTLNRTLSQLASDYELPDHSDLNQARYPWAVPLFGKPAIYGSRLWEYPYAIISSDIEKGMKCADIGCGMTPFPIYLKEISGCQVVGIDSEIFPTGTRYKAFGVSLEFVERTGLKIVPSGLDAIPLKSNSFDRVFCLSVIEHLDPETTERGLHEMARIVKPGGRVTITVDVNMMSDLTRPLDLIWESGLQTVGGIDIRWPRRRLGIFCDGSQPADVFGMVLTKEDYEVDTQYSDNGKPVRVVPASLVPTLRKPMRREPRWRRAVVRLMKSLTLQRK